ncbi:MAG: hypothetical protein Q9165_007945 [Trypethelium subeluteriae]
MFALTAPDTTKLLRDPDQRMKIETLVREIKAQSNLFWGRCCDLLYNETTSLAESALTSREEKIIFHRHVEMVRWEKDVDEKKFTETVKRPSTFAISESNTLERRLVLAPDDSWPFAEFTIDTCE